MLCALCVYIILTFELHGLIRFPRNPEIAKQWNSALGFDVDKHIPGRVCFQHFEDDCFKRKNKTELKANSVPTIFETIQPNLNASDEADCTSFSVPPASAIAGIHSLSSLSTSITSINPQLNLNAADDVHCTDRTDHISPSDFVDADNADPSNNSPLFSALSTSATSATANNHSLLDLRCAECVSRDEIIQQKNDEIKKLRKSLQKAQQKVWHLESVKRRLNAAFSELKSKSLIDEELCETLEVCIIVIPKI